MVVVNTIGWNNWLGLTRNTTSRRALLKWTQWRLGWCVVKNAYQTRGNRSTPTPGIRPLIHFCFCRWSHWFWVCRYYMLWWWEFDRGGIVQPIAVLRIRDGYKTIATLPNCVMYFIYDSETGKGPKPESGGLGSAFQKQFGCFWSRLPASDLVAILSMTRWHIDIITVLDISSSCSWSANVFANFLRRFYTFLRVEWMFCARKMKFIKLRIL